MHDFLPPPPAGYLTSSSYVLTPRTKRAFHTVLDAANILDLAGNGRSTVTFAPSGDGFSLALEHPLKTGRITESLHCHVDQSNVRGGAFRRELFDHTDTRVRLEEADHKSNTLGLPPNLYPEVALPFMLGWLPYDKKARSFHAWINDRFVARVYVEQGKTSTLRVPAGQLEVLDVEMYPDLDDWVNVGATVAKLMRPLVPKYRMSYETKAPFRLVRFEGPYGPPGAPEVVLELAT